eukprot:UN10716
MILIIIIIFDNNNTTNRCCCLLQKDKTNSFTKTFNFEEFKFINKRNYYMSYDKQTAKYTLNITEETSNESAREIIEQYNCNKSTSISYICNGR